MRPVSRMYLTRWTDLPVSLPRTVTRQGAECELPWTDSQRVLGALSTGRSVNRSQHILSHALRTLFSR